eukprot:gene7836-12310_t
MSQRTAVLSSFKNLMKTRSKVFKNDKNLLDNSRNQILLEYRENKNLTDPNQVKELIEKSYQVSQFLEFELAQAVKEEEAEGYNIKLRNDQVSELVGSEVKFTPIDKAMKHK